MWEKKGSRCLSHICVTISIWNAQLQEHQLRVRATQTLFQHGHLSAVLMIWIKWLHLFPPGINMRLLTWDRNPHGSVHFEKKKEEKKKATITTVGKCTFLEQQWSILIRNDDATAPLGNKYVASQYSHKQKMKTIF